MKDGHQKNFLLWESGIGIVILDSGLDLKRYKLGLVFREAEKVTLWKGKTKICRKNRTASERI